MTDKELLEAAEQALMAGRSADEQRAMYQLSIANSLLVIARNSLPITDHKVVGVDPAKPGADRSVYRRCIPHGKALCPECSGVDR